jgi:hypothetical protein
MSIGWSISVPRTVAEVERGLVYIGGAAALLLVARSRAALLAGALAGVTLVCVDALIQSRISRVPDRFEGTLLFRPVGYANGLAALAAIGLPMAVGLSVRASTRGGRALAAASTAPLAAVLVLAQSGGAYAALLLAAVAAVLLERRRIAFASLAAPAAATTCVAAAAALAAGPGTRWLLVFLMVAALVAGLATSRPERPDGRVVLTAAVVLALVAVPAAAIRHGTALGDRAEYWRAGLAAYTGSPVAGTGAGTFALDWLAHRHRQVATLDAHSLELETLTELGPIGFLLVSTMLAIPIVGAVRRRNDPLVPAAAAAYLVLVVHAAVDWDWEQPAVWLAGFAAGVALVATSGGKRWPPAARWTGALAFVTIAAAAAAGLHGNNLVADSRKALREGRPDAAALAAARAADWQPWASEPLVMQGEAALALRNQGGALAFVVRGLAKDPHDPKLWLSLAALSRPDVAKAARGTAERLDPLGRPARAP